MAPFLLSITGAHSGCGKTYLAEIVLKNITISWGAVKYTPTDLYASLIDDPVTLSEQGKDTARYLAAGAQSVLWVSSAAEDLDEILSIALDRLSHCRGILVEGNGPALRFSSNATIFVFGDDPDDIKPSGRAVLEKADYILCPPDFSIKTTGKVYNKYSQNDIVALCDEFKKRIEHDH